MLLLHLRFGSKGRLRLGLPQYPWSLPIYIFRTVERMDTEEVKKIAVQKSRTDIADVAAS